MNDTGKGEERIAEPSNLKMTTDRYEREMEHAWRIGARWVAITERKDDFRYWKSNQ